MTNPADDRDQPYLEIVEDSRGRWSWVLWDQEHVPQCLSAISYGSLKEAAEHLKESRKLLVDAEVMYFQTRRGNGKTIRKRLSKLTEFSR